MSFSVFSRTDNKTKNETETKRTYTRLDFSLEDEERLIEYVKSNHALYNPKDSNYKNKTYRDRLWDKFGQQINRNGIYFNFIICNKIRLKYESYFHYTGLDCSKKWVNIRDSHNRNKGKKLGTGSSAVSKKKRNELMAFLEEIVVNNSK